MHPIKNHLRFCICILSSLLWLSVPGRVSGETYFTDAPELRTLRYLYNRAGMVFPFSAFPVHGSDLLDSAERLPPPASERDRRLLDNLTAGFGKQREGRILLTGGLAASYEHRLRSASVLADDAPVKNGVDFYRQYLALPPVLGLNAGIGAFTGVYVEADAALRKPWTGDYDPVNNFLLPIDSGGSEIDINFDLLNRGMLFWNGAYINIGFGRDRVHIGTAQGATLYPSAALPYLDGLRISTPIGPFTMDYFLATIQPRRARGIEPDLDSDEYGFMMDAHPTTILTAAHHFQWNFGRVKAGIGGNVVYARSNNMFLMSDIIPVQIWHNADIRPNNLSMILDASWAVYPGFTLSGMIGFDDINAGFIGISDDAVPTIPAGILQLEYDLLAERFWGSFMAEWGYTHFLWGNYGYDGPPGDAWGGVYLARAIYRYSPNNDSVLLPLTSPYGPGVCWGRLKGSVTITDIPSLELGADILLLTKVRGANLVTTEYRNGGVDDESRFWYFSLDLSGAYTWKFLRFSLAPALLIQGGDLGFECNLGVTYTLQGKKYL